jgi:hypothetical protein
VNFWESIDELGPVDIYPLMNAAVYLVTTCYLGTSLWKAASVAAFVFVATKYHYGRRTLIRIGFVMALVVTPFWLGIAPPLNELAAMARPVGTVLVTRAHTP